MTLRSFLGALVVALALPLPARAVTVVHSNDVLGEIEPCGCRSNPLGGLARKYHLLEKIPDRELIQLDAGDLLFPTDVVPPLLADQSELQASYLLKALDLLHHDAAVPGEKDFALGIKVFDRLRKKAKLRFIAANLKKAKGGAYLPAHWIAVRKSEHGKPLRVGVFGLVGTELTWPPELKATDPLAAARAQVAALRAARVDVVIALTHEGADADLKLAQEVPGIDLIIGGHSQSFFQTPRVVEHGPGAPVTRIYQSSFRDQYVGEIPLRAHVITNDAEYKLIGLDASLDSPPDHPSPMDALVTEFKAKIAELNEKTDPETLARTENAAVPAQYQTFPRCAECHLKQFEFWRKTPHALALTALVGKEQFHNKECLGCHTVGLGKDGGYSDVTKLGQIKDPGTQAMHWLMIADLHPFLRAVHDAKDLDTPIPWPLPSASPQPLRRALSSMGSFYAPVQCENCHGIGADHPVSAANLPRVEKTVCLSCHTSERAPDWYGKDGRPDDSVIDAKFQAMKCPAGTLSEDAK